MTISVGSKVFYFDDNHREYLPGRQAPIYAKGWREAQVVGESRTHWHIAGIEASTTRIPKVGPDMRRVTVKGFGYSVALSPEAVQDDIYIHERRHRIAEAIQRCTDVEFLKEIETKLGLKP